MHLRPSANCWVQYFISRNYITKLGYTIDGASCICEREKILYDQFEIFRRLNKSVMMKLSMWNTF